MLKHELLTVDCFNAQYCSCKCYGIAAQSLFNCEGSRCYRLPLLHNCGRFYSTLLPQLHGHLTINALSSKIMNCHLRSLRLGFGLTLPSLPVFMGCALSTPHSCPIFKKVLYRFMRMLRQSTNGNKTNTSFGHSCVAKSKPLGKEFIIKTDLSEFFGDIIESQPLQLARAQTCPNNSESCHHPFTAWSHGHHIESKWWKVSSSIFFPYDPKKFDNNPEPSLIAGAIKNRTMPIDQEDTLRMEEYF